MKKGGRIVNIRMQCFFGRTSVAGRTLGMNLWKSGMRGSHFHKRYVFLSFEVFLLTGTQALCRLVQEGEIEKAFGTHLRKIILYGSYARGISGRIQM